MKLGIFLNAQHPAADDPARRFAEMVEQARLIRSLGFDSIWGGEHHATPGFHYFPLLPMLQRLAAEVPGLAIGTNLVLLPLHNPVEIAEVGAFLDVVTGGRFMLGVGLGYRPEEFAIFGVPMAERVSRLSEGVEIIRRLWTEDKVTHRGRHWRLENVTIRPRPVQRPRPPILVGAQVPTGIARAARIADGWLVVPVPRVDEFAAQVQAFTATRAKEGLPAAAEICRLLEVVCARDERPRSAAPRLPARQVRGLSRGTEGVSLDPPPGRRSSSAAWLPTAFAIGSPAQVTRMLLAQHEAGATHLTMRVSWPGMPQADVLAGIELLGREVVPEVRRRLAAAR
jgi:alkanesulfonate monooxygenase SsuD/methylene tetrahydromethanopterin reductase-like flavin-dependent oxidoreductase (luciferase family)